MIAETALKEKAETLSKMMGDVKARLLVDMLLDNVEKVNERR